MVILENTSYTNIRGFNYQPSYGSSGCEIWNFFNPAVIENEIALGKKYFPRINALRIWLSWDAFLRDSEKFKYNLETFLEITKRYELKAIPVLFNGWHSFPDFGGISLEQIKNWKASPVLYQDYFYSYLKASVGIHAKDSRVLLWDLCNEPFSIATSGEEKGLVFEWLRDLYYFCKKFRTDAPLGIGVAPSDEDIQAIEPVSDVITIHPYWARNAWVKDKDKFGKFLDKCVKFANKNRKPLLATETGWGHLNDEERVEQLEYELQSLQSRKIGFTAHLLWHTLVADGHRPEYGPVSQAGYMAFIEPDGSLRMGHESFNRFCGEGGLFKGKVNFFEEHTRRVVEKCKVVTEIEGKSYTLYAPSGDMKYKGFWIRDAVYIAESGFVKPEEIKGWIELVGSRQNEVERKLENGLVVPANAIPDHINFDGSPVFFPGTYASGNNQGDGTYGFFPPHDDQYFFIEMVHQYFRMAGETKILKEHLRGIPLWERLCLAFESYHIDPGTQLCFSERDRHTVDWGFCDTITKSGLLLFPSLLRYQAALMLKELLEKAGDRTRAKHYLETAKTLQKNIRKVFWDGNGWLFSATETGREYDVIGTLFAVYLNILEKNELQTALSVISRGYLEKRSVDEDGYVRYIPEGEDFSESTAWEKALSALGDYQNGGYWAFAAGWYIFALSKIDPRLARGVFDALATHTLNERREGALFEWKNNQTGHRDGGFYGASAALPYKFASSLW